MKPKNTIIHPEDTNNLVYWTRKWGVTIQQLNNAILDTGSVDLLQVKKHLKKDIWFYSPLTGLFKMLRLKALS